MTEPEPIRPDVNTVIMYVGRSMYEAYCEHKGWDPFPAPYVDAGSLRAARVAVDMLGYDDYVLDGMVAA